MNIKMAFRFLSVLAVVAIVSQSAVVAQTLKIGYLNPQEVLEKMPETAKIEQELNSLATTRQEAFNTRLQKFQTDVQRFQQNANLMAADVSEKEQQRLMDEDQALQNMQTEIQQELMNKRNDLLRPVLQKIDDAISATAKELGLTYVLNESTSQGETILLFVSDDGKNRLNITQQVIAKVTK